MAVSERNGEVVGNAISHYKSTVTTNLFVGVLKLAGLFCFGLCFLDLGAMIVMAFGLVERSRRGGSVLGIVMGRLGLTLGACSNVSGVSTLTEKCF